jgi:hypothetical protein
MVKSHRNKKPNVTIITDAKTLDEVKTWAKSRGLSMNALINDMLTKNTFFFKYVEEHECMIIPSTIYKNVIDLLPEKTLTDLVYRTSHEMVQSIFAHNNIMYTIDNMIRFYFDSVGMWSGLYNTFKNYNDMGTTHLIFEHKYDIKWSRIILSVISDMMEEMLNMSPSKKKILPNTVILQIEER